MHRILSLGMSMLFVFSGATLVLSQDGQKALDSWAKFVVGGTFVATVGNDHYEHTYRWLVPGKTLHLDGRGGPLPFVAVIHVDAATKQCAWTYIHDDGTTAKGTIVQNSDKVWTVEARGQGLQGEHRFRDKVTQVDDNTGKSEALEYVINGKPQPLETVTWKRIGQSTRKEFDEYCQLMQGLWVGELTLVADLPDFGKKGDKLNAYGRNQISEDGNSLESTFFGGQGSASGIIWFDAEKRQIRAIAVTSGGTFWESAVSKEDGKWVSRSVSGSNPDGAANRGISTLTISDNGNTHTWTGTGTIGGQSTDPQKDVYRRVNNK